MSYILKEVPVEQCSTQITSHRVHIGKEKCGRSFIILYLKFFANLVTATKVNIL